MAVVAALTIVAASCGGDEAAVETVTVTESAPTTRWLRPRAAECGGCFAFLAGVVTGIGLRMGDAMGLGVGRRKKGREVFSWARGAVLLGTNAAPFVHTDDSAGRTDRGRGDDMSTRTRRRLSDC